MVDIIPPQTVLTPTDAANELQSEGLDALGLTVPTLSPAWATATPSAGNYDAANLSLTVTGVRAPFRGILTFDSTPTRWSGVAGTPLTGPIAVLQLHPEAAQRLETLVAARFGTPQIRPVPVAMVMRDFTPPAPLPVPNWYLAGENLGLGGSVEISFHDRRGLVVDAIAVAHLFRDLIGWRPALEMSQDAAATQDGAGGLNGIAALATGIRCHVIDPHGWGYAPTRDVARLKVLNSENAEVSTVADGGLVDLAAGQRLGRSPADDAAEDAVENPVGTVRPLRWGWATFGTLGRTALTPPSLPGGSTITRQFFRMMAVDLDWHLLGNRSASPLAGIPGDDDTIPDFLLPKVRPAVPTFDYLADGMDVLGATAEIASGFPPGGGAGAFAIAVSPVIVPALAVPPGIGGTGHWPTFPPPNPMIALTMGTDPRTALTGRWRDGADGAGADRDAILTLPADTVPAGTHVRIYPRRFVEIQAIGEQPSFVRGDGGAAIATSGNPVRILLVNPFALSGAEPRPNPARLEVDIVLTSRTGQRQIFSVVAIALETSPETWDVPLTVFGGQALLATPALAALFAAFSTQAIAPSSVFGLPRTLVPPPGDPSGIADLVRRLASEDQPRQGPRLPTQARFETILALGTSASPSSQLSWNAVLTGARWDWESRSARPELGNPGNPAGPDVHATGIRCDGQLAYDLALHGLKRAQAIVPVSASSPGWVVTTGGENWNEPALDASGTVSAAMLETIAPFCDTPELGLIPGDPSPGDSVQNTVDAIAAALNVPSPTLTVGNEAQIRPRVQRERVTAKYGQRDALWALRRAIGQAREMIYIESPAFARTAYPDGTPTAAEIDLVEVIRQQMADNPRLKVIICVPREPDFAAEKANWVRAALKHRKEAIEHLTGQDRQRVAAFHPIGFPGRSAVIRSTTVIVDDVWCLVGTSHLRRRGLTFDGGVDIVSLDRAIARGYSSRIAQFRQTLMAAKLGVEVPSSPETASPLWIRLFQPESAFDAIADLLQQGGLGRCRPVWEGPTDTSVMEQSLAIADPNGVDADESTLLSLFLPLLLED
ncbi:MAG: hypothetical protein VKK04_24195 [Synechococcales bacterium]|nr:hypothetical protein [Synechococcales bacterium]